jgi:nitrite reductase/ring-hydroxylating ferredoxin subunit
MIRCRWHNYVFRLNDGKAVNCPGFKLKVFEVKREEKVLLARPVT